MDRKHLATVIERIKNAHGVGTVAIRNMLQENIPQWTGEDTRKLLLTLRKRKVLDYRYGRWYYVPQEDRHFFTGKLRNKILKLIPWLPLSIGVAELVKKMPVVNGVPTVDRKEMENHLQVLYKTGRIGTEIRTHKLTSGKRKRYRVFYRVHKGDS